MAIGQDRVQVTKIESTTQGGDDSDMGPYGSPQPLDPQEDAIESAGGYVQSEAARDETVGWFRDASNNLNLFDQVAGTKTLTELAAHKALRQLIHFIDNGPAEGFTSGAYRETVGTVKPTSIIWYTDSGKSQKIIEKNTTWSGVKATSIEWKMYAVDGATVIATVTDTITYSGIFETSRARAIA